MSERPETYLEIIAGLNAKIDILEGRRVEAEVERDYFMAQTERLEAENERLRATGQGAAVAGTDRLDVAGRLEAIEARLARLEEAMTPYVVYGPGGRKVIEEMQQAAESVRELLQTIAEVAALREQVRLLEAERDRLLKERER